MKKNNRMKNERLLSLNDNYKTQIKNPLELAELLYNDNECFELL